MFDRLQALVRRALVSDVPPEMSLCLDCGKLVCSEFEFRNCARRKERAAELAASNPVDLQLSGDTDLPSSTVSSP